MLSSTSMVAEVFEARLARVFGPTNVALKKLFLDLALLCVPSEVVHYLSSSGALYTANTEAVSGDDYGGYVMLRYHAPTVITYEGNREWSVQ